MCKYRDMYSIYQVFLKKFPCHSKIIPVTAEGKPRQEAGAGWVRVLWLLCRQWIPVRGGRRWPSLPSIVLHISLSPLASSPHVLAACPQSEMHPRGVCSTPATEQREEHAVPRASPNPLLGPINGREEGRRREENG